MSMRMGITRPGEEQLHETFIGAGALSYPWWTVGDEWGIDARGDADKGWGMTVYVGVEGEDDELEAARVNADRIWTAVCAIASGFMDTSPQIAAKCMMVVAGCMDEADFDAADADTVLQIATLGEIRYA